MRPGSQLRFGAYRLIRLLGRGGMAAVWKAEEDAAPGRARAVALKLILPHLRDQPEVERMFLQECRLANRLRHPNIVRALSSGRIDGQPFVALELIDGVDLRACARTPVPVACAAFIVRELCAALSYAHRLEDDRRERLRVVHRDVTPSNILLGRDGAVKLTDFGIAKALGDPAADTTRHGMLKGTIGYMAPEVLSGAPYDHRADLFSLGVILYELLTHERLFRSEGKRELLARKNGMQVRPASAVNPKVPPLLEWVAMRALEHEPDARYATADEMAADLDEVLERRPGSRAQTAALVEALVAESAADERPQTTFARTRPTEATTALERPSAANRSRVPRRAIGLAVLALVFTAVVLAVQGTGGRASTVVDDPEPAGALVPDVEELLPRAEAAAPLRPDELVRSRY